MMFNVIKASTVSSYGTATSKLTQAFVGFLGLMPALSLEGGVGHGHSPRRNLSGSNPDPFNFCEIFCGKYCPAVDTGNYCSGGVNSDQCGVDSVQCDKVCKEQCALINKACTRETWSIVNPNTSWDSHTFHPQVWYHSLEDTYGLWKEDYFDYVLDVRPLQDFDYTETVVLKGWETLHIPGSFPINVFPADQPTDEVEMLVDFTQTNVCKDSRILVHCWTGIAGNRVAKTLIELGFTNVHAMGPQGSAGIIQWEAAGYEIVYNDKFEATDSRLQPSCMSACGM